jgi:4-amino-4-deoxy-L-arabinose transferase
VGCRLGLAAPARRAELERALAAYGVRWRRIADVRGYAGLAQLSDDCAWRVDDRVMLPP